MFSRRSDFDLRPNALARALEHARAQGSRLLDLTLSNPTQADLPYPPLPLVALDDSRHYEPAPFGLPSARRNVADWMAAQGVPVDPEHVVLTASTSEAYAFLFKLLCDPGDAVLAPKPSYPLIEHLAQLESVVVDRYPLRYDGRFHVDLHGLRSAIHERTRAILAVHPNNPTGSYLDADELASIHATELPLISDEVFAPYALDDRIAPLATARRGNRGLVFSMHGLSKLGLPQMKLSWICVGGEPARVNEALGRLEMIADSFLSVATPVQLALPEILMAQEALVSVLRARLRENLDVLRAALAGGPATVLHASGGWYAVLRVPSVQDDESWALELLTKDAVHVQPGYFYDFEGGPYLVISLLPRPDVLAAGARRIAQRIQRTCSAPSPSPLPTQPNTVANGT